MVSYGTLYAMGLVGLGVGCGADDVCGNGSKWFCVAMPNLTRDCKALARYVMSALCVLCVLFEHSFCPTLIVCLAGCRGIFFLSEFKWKRRCACLIWMHHKVHYINICSIHSPACFMRLHDSHRNMRHLIIQKMLSCKGTALFAHRCNKREHILDECMHC